MIPGYGMSNAIELNMQDRTGGDKAVFYQSVMNFLGALNQRSEVAMAYSSYVMNFPQVSVDVDAAKCRMAGISPAAVLEALGSYCGGSYISNYNQYGKVYRVMMQASPEYRLDEQALDNMFVRNGTEMAPISQFVTLQKVLGSKVSNRFNLYSSITANVNPGKFLASAVGSLTQPLFARGQLVGQLKIARAQQEEAALAFQQTLLNAGSEVNNTLTAHQTARAKTALLDKQVASLQSALKSTGLLMEHGTTTYLEVLTARQSLLNAQLTQTSNRFMEIQSLINLYQALGGGQE